MFYHIRIDYFDTKLNICKSLFSYDITDIHIVEEKIKSYLNGDTLILSGSKLKGENIRQFRVFSSQYVIDKCVEIGDSKLTDLLWCYTNETIFERKELCPEITEDLFSKIDAKNINAMSSGPIPPDVKHSKNIFIVHGHNKTVRTEVELFIKKLGYNPIVLFKQPDGGTTIIEKLERETTNVSFAIILYTYCDEGKAREEKEYKHRARQNVVFEHGMVCGLMGRKKVLALVEPGVEMPGDLSGIVYKIIDESGHWQLEVAKEMKAAGLDIDLNCLLK